MCVKQSDLEVLPGRRPFEILNLDHVGPFIRSTSGYNYVLVAVDNLIKYFKLYVVRDCGTNEVLWCLKKFVQEYG